MSNNYNSVLPTVLILHCNTPGVTLFCQIGGTIHCRVHTMDNPFLPNVPFLIPLEICFQGILKETLRRKGYISEQ